jgi:replicative DNA helicase
MNIRSIYVSADMGSNMTNQKLIQRHTGESDETIYNNIKNSNKESIENYSKILQSEYKNVHFCFNTNPSLNDIKNVIKASNDMTGEEVKLVLIDYLELIRVDASDSTAATSMQIQGLRQIANELNVCIVVLIQPNKANSKQNEPILSSTGAKGSGDIDKACTAMLTAYRPGFNPEDTENDKWFSVICVKNRLGSLFSLNYRWDGKRGIIKEMSSIEHQELRDFLKEKKEEKEAKKGGTWGNTF